MIEFRCRLCGEKFESFKEVKNHVLECHKVPGRSFNISPCSFVHILMDENEIENFFSARYGLKEFWIDEVICKHKWLEVVLFFDVNHLKWSEIGEMLSRMEEDGIRIVDVKTDWVDIYGCDEEWGLIARVWVDIEKVIGDEKKG